MALILSPKEDAEFKQMILLIVNLVWLILEFLVLDWDTPIKFRVIRLIFFMFCGVTRIDIFDHPETDDDFWPKVWKTFKVWCTDVASMCFVIWAFGISAYMQPLEILEGAVTLTMMFLAERIFSEHNSFLWQASLRSEDWRKQWKRKPNVQIIAVCLGAWFGCCISMLRHNPAPFPAWSVDFAVWFSLAANSVSFFFF